MLVCGRLELVQVLDGGRLVLEPVCGRLERLPALAYGKLARELVPACDRLALELY